MKKFIRMLGIIILLSLTACSKSVEAQVAEQIELAQRYLAETRYEEAIIAFNKIIEIDEKNVDAYLGLGQIYEAQAKEALDEQDFESVEELLALAEEMYKKIQGINPEDERLTELFAKVEELRNQAKDEKEAIEQAKREDEERLLAEKVKAERKEAVRNNEIVKQIIDLCENSNYDSVYELIVSDEYQRLYDEILCEEDFIFESGDGKGIGFYGTYIYYGDYVAGMRDGHGVWLNAHDGQDESIYGYKAEGDWANDKPNGYQELIDGEIIMRGYVKDGIWDGEVEESFVDHEESVFIVTYNNGYAEVLDESQGEDGKTHYVISERYNDDGSLDGTLSTTGIHLSEIWGIQ